MPKVLCKLPNASTSISGYTFVRHRDGMISEELDAKVAEEFASIAGYEIYDPSGTDPAAQAILEAARKQREQAERQAAPPAPAAPPSPPAGAAAQPPAAPPPPPPAAPAAPSTSSSTPPEGKPPVATEPQF